MTRNNTAIKTPFNRAWQAGGLILLAYALRVYGLGYQSLWRDEVDAIRFSSGGIADLWQMLPQPGHNGPLYFIILQGWRALTGDSEFALRYGSVAGGVLAVALIYRVGRQFGWGKNGSLLAATLAATSPYLIWYSQEAKMYSWLSAVVLVAVYAFCAAIAEKESAGRWTVVFVAATSLSFYLHILSPLMLAVYGLWAIPAWPKIQAHPKRWLSAAAALTLPYVPLILWQAPMLWTDFNSGHPFYPFPKQMWLLLHFYSAGILRWPASPYLIGLTSFLALAAFRPHQGMPPRRKVTAAGLWFIVPAVAVFLISLRVPVFEDRYVIFIAPAYYLLVSAGITSLPFRYGRQAAVILATILIALNMRAIYQQANTPIKANFRAGATYIATEQNRPANVSPLTAAEKTAGRFKVFLPVILNQRCPVIMFQMPYLQYTFDYYFDGCYQALEGVWTNDQIPATTVDREMQARVGGLSSLWLVVAEEDYWDKRHLTRQWLDEHATRQDEAHFTGVDIYRYRFEPQGTPSGP